jgi:Rod binding domain-containing protein
MSNLGIANAAATQATAAAAASPAVPQPRLVRAAHEFEAAMMKELMAPLQSGHDILGGDSDDEGSSTALSSFASDALGKAVSEHGGFGIAKSIIHQLTPTSNHFGKSLVPAVHTGNTVDSGLK